MKKLLSFILCVCLLCPAMAFASEPAGNQLFSDVSEADWFYGYVKNANEKGFLQPLAENTFSPDVPITRAAFIAAIAILSGDDISAFTQSSFSDVKSTDSSSPYIEWAYKNSIASGTDVDTFSPDASITREQAATFIHRFLDKKDYVVSNVKTSFKDAESISEYALLPVTICQNAGILSGYSDSTFNPAGMITRAEAAACITKLETYINDRKKDFVFNERDQEKIVTAIKALDMSIKEGMDLAKDIYTIAFDKSLAVTGNAKTVLDYTFALNANPVTIEKETVILMETVVDGLYGGTKIEEIPGKYFGNKKESITASDFVTGDIIAFENAESAVMYIYHGKEFSKLDYETDKEAFDTVVEKALSSERFVVLRPSYGLPNIIPSLPYQEEKMNASQKAVVATAQNYLLRGYRVQYGDTRLAPSGEFRWTYDEKAPEEYTSSEWGYSNCAAFVTDVHRYAIGWETDMSTTTHLIGAETIRSFYYKPTGKETEAEKAEIEKKFYKSIIPSDIICIRRHNGSGHAMLYVGNGDIIHSSGSTYNYTTGVEKYEPTVRYLQLRDLLMPEGGENRYIFGGKVSEVAILRPVNIWTGIFPADSVKRVANMTGIVAEKLSSHKSGMTVNPGDEMTFTFSVYNTNDYEVTLPISDTVPSNTTYVSGAQKVNGKNLSWNITVGAEETKTVSYTVRVNGTIDSENPVVESKNAKVGEVSANCTPTQIRRTLTKSEQEKIIKAVDSYEFASDNPVQNANAIYNNAFFVRNVLSANTTEDVANGLFVERSEKQGTYAPKKDGKIANMLAPSLFGGRAVFGSTGDATVASPAYEYKVHGAYYRTRLVREQNLMVGDIVARYDKESSAFYIYTGNGLVDLSGGEKVADTKSCLEGLLSSQLYFAVIRPAAAMK